MSDQSAIEWTDATWSPVTGCHKLSPGCKNCYAEREVTARWSKNPKSVFYGRPFTDVRTHPEALDRPSNWSRGRRIFVCPRADLFHDQVPFEFILEVFVVMAANPRHTFQVLTKRAARMAEFFTWLDAQPARQAFQVWPLPNVWLGTSVEDNDSARARIHHLLACPAAIRFVSAEPLLDILDLTLHVVAARRDRPCIPLLHWVIVGGESGRGARPMHPDWVRQLRDECARNGWAFFFKQWGEWAEDDGTGGTTGLTQAIRASTRGTVVVNELELYRYGKRLAGRLLDGQQHSEFPAP